MTFWYTGSATAGILFGAVFVYIHKQIIRPGMTRKYLNALFSDILGLLKGDLKDFWIYYLRLIRQSLFYAFMQLSGVMIALLPIIMAIFYISGPVLEAWNKGALPAVIPSKAGNLEYAFGKADTSPPSHNNRMGYELVLKDKKRLKLENMYDNYLISKRNNFLFKQLMEFNNFTVISVPPTWDLGVDHVVLRSLRGNMNPFWPYLCDLEFVFLLFLASATTMMMLWSPKNKTGAQSQSVKTHLVFSDYMLTWVATQTIGLMKKAGDLESRILGKRMAQKEIGKPIYVSGLARSGTTIVLETLSKDTKLATHRYKDFPFVMTPFCWDTFTRLFSSEQVPVERPHKDQIKISQSSPDAFEEPIWQHFFPCLHDLKSLSILDDTISKPDFEQFYREHIKKILCIRKGERYLAKGNYNLTRIRYILKIFPDAKMVVPIRHPKSHVESLVRQHQLFLEYAKGNPQVAEYLKAAGHYEFGPQRCPVILDHDSGSRTIAAWENGDDTLGYSIQWTALYKYVLELSQNETISNQLYIIRYEDLCYNPAMEVARLMDFLELEPNEKVMAAVEEINSQPPKYTLSDQEANSCWQEAKSVATLYGYTRNIEAIRYRM